MTIYNLVRSSCLIWATGAMTQLFYLIRNSEFEKNVLHSLIPLTNAEVGTYFYAVLYLIRLHRLLRTWVWDKWWWEMDGSHYFHYYHYWGVCPSVLYPAIVMIKWCSSETLALTIIMQGFNLQLDHHFVNKVTVETCGCYSVSYPKTIPCMFEDLPH